MNDMFILRAMRPVNLNEYFSRPGRSPEKLAEQLGVSTRFVYMLRNGERRPSPDLAKKISKITGISFQRLLLPEEPVAK